MNPITVHVLNATLPARKPQRSYHALPFVVIAMFGLAVLWLYVRPG